MDKLYKHTLEHVSGYQREIYSDDFKVADRVILFSDCIEEEVEKAYIIVPLHILADISTQLVEA